MNTGIGRVLAALSLALPERRRRVSFAPLAPGRRHPRPQWVAGRYVMIDDYRFAMLARLPRRKRRHWLAHNRNKAPRVRYP